MAPSLPGIATFLFDGRPGGFAPSSRRHSAFGPLDLLTPWRLRSAGPQRLFSRTQVASPRAHAMAPAARWICSRHSVFGLRDLSVFSGTQAASPRAHAIAPSVRGILRFCCFLLPKAPSERPETGWGTPRGTALTTPGHPLDPELGGGGVADAKTQAEVLRTRLPARFPGGRPPCSHH